VVRYDTNHRTYFRSKARALIYENSITAPTQTFFHFYDQQFASIRVDQEPEQTMESLLKERALELRGTYKYLRLWLSGGSDSMTALHAFVSNNIPVDEIVVHIYDNDDINNNPVFNRRPLIDVAIPYLHQWREQLKNTKITIYRSDLNTLAAWHTDPNFHGEINHIDGAIESLGSQLRLPTTGAMLTIDDPKISPWCDILGGTKARVCLRNGLWYMYFADSALLSGSLATTSEDFFISKNNPHLFLKTAYQLKNFFQSQGLGSKEIDQWCSLGTKSKKFTHQYNQALGRLWLPNTSYSKAGPGGDYKLEDDDTAWCRSAGMDEHRISKIYQHNQQLLVNNFNFLWNRNEHGEVSTDHGMKGHISLFYCLDNGTIHDSAGIWA
jgi:hypothetical protein